VLRRSQRLRQRLEQGDALVRRPEKGDTSMKRYSKPKVVGSGNVHPC